MQNIENSCSMLEEDKATKDRQNRSLKREEIQIAEDRCNHLAKVKLGDSLDEAEDALERERKSKGGVEKIKRKLNGDLKLTQEAVTSLVRIKANLYQTEDEKTLGMQYRAKVRSKSKTSMYQLEDKNRLADPSLRLRLVRRLRNWSPPNRR